LRRAHIEAGAGEQKVERLVRNINRHDRVSLAAVGGLLTCLQ
jgi:hypothetical protein